MSNQYSRGCGYNYRRSMQMPREAAMPQSSCSCTFSSDSRPPRRSLAMGYVPMQIWSQPLAPCKGLQIGTIFADLDKPFCGRGGAWK